MSVPDTKIESDSLSDQYRCPSGDMGKYVGKKMDELNYEQNEWVLSLMEIKASDRVLEIGFGTGKTLAKANLLAMHGHVSGVEISDTMLAEAKILLNDSIVEGKADLHKADAASLPFENNSFDKIFSVHVVYFWDNLDRVCAELFRVAKVNALVAIYYVSPILSPTTSYHDYTTEDIEDALKRAGFPSISVQTKEFGSQHGISLMASK